MIKISNINLDFNAIKDLNSKIIKCNLCSRLVDFRQEIAFKKRKQFQSWNYWGKPVPGYGSFSSNLLLTGLAPAAHGGNRTGRVFTGDKSAAFLVNCLNKAGISNQSNSDSLDDGLILNNTYMTAVLKCVPPGDKPKSDELMNCSKFLEMN